MIIWGGWTYTGSDIFFNTGGRYNPSTDTWLSTSTGANVPEAREQATAIWSGTEMIVWGGYSCSGFRCSGGYTVYSTGGRYSPMADSWKSTSTGSGVPPGSSSHRAVWTDSQMIVWGGGNPGGLYYPLPDTWGTVNQARAPINRVSHTAIYTGREMIIWGGSSGTVYQNTGGQYDSRLDQWQPTPIDNSTPTPRGAHSAVWTGSEMIVWGGYSVNGTLAVYHNDGGRYNPDNRLWLPTTLIGAPAPRDYQTAVWTGSSMIVWGGEPNLGTATSGGIYTSGSAPSPGNTLRGTKSSSVNLTWSWITGAGSYNVKRCDPAASGCIPATIVSTPTINQYSEPNDALSHFYAIEAVNQCGATP